jgi:peptide/nickel transport system substrate-binding protein
VAPAKGQHRQRAIPVVASPAATSSVEIALVLQQAAQQIGLNLGREAHAFRRLLVYHWMKHPVGFGNVNTRPTPTSR